MPINLITSWDLIYEEPQGRYREQRGQYPRYYRGENVPPADWDSPILVFFLTVCETLYLFALAARRQVPSELLETAAHWLKGALTELGIGAKTSADYGVWQILGDQRC